MDCIGQVRKGINYYVQKNINYWTIDLQMSLFKIKIS